MPRSPGLLLAALALAAAPHPARPDEGIEFFEKKVRPVLVRHCYPCHSSASKPAQGGLMLDTKANLLRGGNSGPPIEPGAPERSLLVKAIRYTDEHLRMPPR